MEYREEYDVTKGYKEKYVDEIDRLILERQRVAAEKRREYCKNIFADPEPYRHTLREMLGWPLVDKAREGVPAVSSEELYECDEYKIYRMKIEILDGVYLTGLFFELKGEGKRPLVLVQHGGWGTPEIMSGLYGESTTYNGVTERVLKKGVHVFAPQLLLWRKDRYNVEYDRIAADARLKQLGSSITAVEVYGLMRILDYFETRDNVSDFGMVGLSYGGFYTLFTAAIDTRIKASISCSFFNTRENYYWADWTWFGFLEKFDDSDIAALVYPRRLCIEVGKKDELFKVEFAEKSFEKLKDACKNVGTEWVRFIPFDGVHEFSKDDEPIEWIVEELLNGQKN